MAKKAEPKVCCICGNRFIGHGNNPAPVKNEGRCCSTCHALHVVPARIEDIRKSFKSNLN